MTHTQGCKNVILEILSRKRMTQSDLIESIGERGRRVSPTYLNRVIAGNVMPSFRLVLQISDILGKPIEDIFYPTIKDIYGGKE